MNWYSVFALVFMLNLVASNAQEDKNKSGGSINSGSAAKCYVCNENTDERCKDPFKADKSLIKDCENGETFCRKIIQTVNGETTVVRQCAKNLYKPDYEGCYKTAGKASQNVCTCRASSGSDAEPCNSGFKAYASTFGLVLSLLVSLVLLK